MKYNIEHHYQSGWKPWPHQDGSFRIYNSEEEAEQIIDKFLDEAGPGYHRAEKRIVPIEEKGIKQ